MGTQQWDPDQQRKGVAPLPREGGNPEVRNLNEKRQHNDHCDQGEDDESYPTLRKRESHHDQCAEGQDPRQIRDGGSRGIEPTKPADGLTEEIPDSPNLGLPHLRV